MVLKTILNRLLKITQNCWRRQSELTTGAHVIRYRTATGGKTRKWKTKGLHERLRCSTRNFVCKVYGKILNTGTKERTIECSTGMHPAVCKPICKRQHTPKWPARAYVGRVIGLVMVFLRWRETRYAYPSHRKVLFLSGTSPVEKKTETGQRTPTRKLIACE